MLNCYRGAFKVPTLREVARTAPYMHDGSLATLEDVIEFYDRGGNPNPYLDSELHQLRLTPEEKQALPRLSGVLRMNPMRNGVQRARSTLHSSRKWSGESTVRGRAINRSGHP